MNPLALLVLLSVIALPGCAAIGDVFQAGAWTGIVGTIVVLVIVGVLFSMFRKK